MPTSANTAAATTATEVNGDRRRRMRRGVRWRGSLTPGAPPPASLHDGFHHRVHTSLYDRVQVGAPSLHPPASRVPLLAWPCESGVASGLAHGSGGHVVDRVG